MKIEVSNGEIIDKYTILEIKLLEINDTKKLSNIQLEHEVLTPVVSEIYATTIDKTELKNLQNNLLEINKKLWKIEDEIRELEREKNFGENFISLARAVYYTNDDRSKIKKEINIVTGSNLVEEKSYEDYQ